MRVMLSSLVRAPAVGRALDGGLLGRRPADTRRPPGPRLRSRPRARPRLGAGALPRPSGRVLAGLGVVLAAAALVVARIGGPAPAGGVDAPTAAVTFEGVNYALLDVSVKKSIRERGGHVITASGVFDIVKLRLRSDDGRPHLISSDLVALKAGVTYYGVSLPDDLGLTTNRWGALTATTSLPAHGTLNVKAIFDVPPAVLRNPASLHIGPFGAVAHVPGETLRFPDPTVVDRQPSSRRPPLVGLLLPDPVLG
jgi:hypothetical protein